MEFRGSPPKQPSFLLSVGIGIVCLAGLGSAAVAGAKGETIGLGPASVQQNGARIFHDGVTAQGRVVQNSHGMEGVGCAMCHGEDGHGGTMHGMFAPNITYSFLTNPSGYVDPYGRRRPPYNKESVKAAIVAGIDAGGKQLDPEMPRWTGLTARESGDRKTSRVMVSLTGLEGICYRFLGSWGVPFNGCVEAA